MRHNAMTSAAMPAREVNWGVVKSTLLATVAASVVLSASLAAQAADLPVRPAPPAVAYIPPPVLAYNWSGFYLGVNGGYGIGNASWTPAGGASSSTSTYGGFAGGTLGFNYQIGALVMGVEGDFDWSGINSSTANTFCVSTGNCQTGNTWLSTLRGRAGYAMDRILFYATAGGVFGNEQLTSGGSTNTHTQAGWTAGLGVEAALAEHWTAKLEYLYADLGNASCTTACKVPTSISLNDNLIRVGINYKF
jgi:outer membrane immunogenic protein